MSKRTKRLVRDEPMDAAELRGQLERLHAASYGWALACCARDPSEAEDVLQGVYWKILAGKARFDGRAEFKTWLFSVIRKTAADAWRRKLVRRLWLAGYGRESVATTSPDPPGSAVERSELQAIFQTALASLPRRQQQALQLVFYHDLSLQQASEVMGVSLGSARTHYERGKANLRKWLKESGVFDEHGIGRSEPEKALR